MFLLQILLKPPELLIFAAQVYKKRGYWTDQDWSEHSKKT